MKMRKILSFVLVLSLVLGSFSMAFAATPTAKLSDIDGLANEEAIQVNNDLGIIKGFPDGTFLPEKAVNRAEFAAMITRALAIPESALAGYTATKFKDMSGYGWATGYISFCESKGIMLGDGQGNAMPGKTITVNEAMTMVLRAIGYVNNSSVLVGSWPANYVTVAQNVGLYDDVAAAVTVDRANAAQIIYNALTVQKVAVNSDGETTYLTTGTGSNVKEVNLLNSGLNCESNEELVVYGDDSLITLTPYVGAWANVYRNDKGDGDIVAVKPISTFLTGEYKTSTQKFTADGVEYTLRLGTNTSAYGVTNAAIDSTTSNAVTLLTNEAIRTIAVDVSGKTITKIYSVANWVVTEDDEADKNTQEEINDDQELLGATFALDVDNEIDLTSFTLVGAASLDKIEKDDVVYVYTYANGATEDIVKVAVGSDVVTGKFTKINGDKLTVAGKDYKMADKAKVYFDSTFGKAAPTDAYLGEEIELTLDAYGNVYSWEATAKTTDKYAVVTAKDAGGFDDERVKLYLSSDETKIFTIDDDSSVTINDFTTPQVIAYSVNADGQIDAVKKTAAVASSATMTGLKTLLVGTTYYAIDADAVVFTITTSATEVTYDVTSVGKVDLNVDLAAGANLFTYVLNDDGEVAAMIVNADKASRDADDVYAVINTKTTVYDEGKDKAVAEVSGFFDGTAATKLGTDSLSGVAKGNLYLVTFDADGYVKNTSGVALTSTSFGGTNVAGDVVQVGNAMVSLSDDAVVYEKVYKTDGSFDKFVVSSTSKIKTGANIFTLDIDAAENDGHEIVVWSEKML